jgi:hypothetical protein
VMLSEDLPFVWGPQPTLRQQVYRFMRRAQKCRHILSRIEQMQQLHDVQDILES